MILMGRKELTCVRSVDLDLTVCPDVFALRAFDEKMPVTRKLPGSSPCELRLLIPDTNIGQDGFHDVVVENLIGSSTWRSKHVSPSDVIALRRRWPRAVFQVMRERSVELEDLRQQAYAGLQSAYRYTGRGYCPVCDIRTEHSLDSHMMCYHLDLGQLWRFPVELCEVWKGSVRECRDHFNDKHSGSETLDFDKVSKSFPAWTVTRDFWERALKPEISGIAVDIRLFHESGRRLIHKYRVYQDPLPHPALREGRISKLISFVNGAMVIAQLTHLRITIPSLGNPPGEVPSDCFLRMDEPGMTKTPKRVTSAPVFHTLTGKIDQDETPTDSPIVTKHKETEEPRVQEIREESTVPLPGFRPFRWPQSDWDDIGDATLDPGLEFVASWSARIMEERSSPPPLVPLSEDSQDSIMVQIGSQASEVYTPIGLDWIRSVNRRPPCRPMKTSTKCEKPVLADDFLFRDILCDPAMITNRSESTGNRDSGRVPRWRLAQEGPFTNERSQASLRVLGKGCAFRHTTYSVEDHAPPEGGLGVPLNHPRFLEWIGAPESAWLLEMSPDQWCDTLSRDQAMTAAMQLHREAYLMKTNLDILDQYALALQGTASKILQKTIGGIPYPRAEVAAAAQDPRARQASVHMEALGLWRPSMDPVQFEMPQCKTSIRDVLNGL